MNARHRDLVFRHKGEGHRKDQEEHALAELSTVFGRVVGFAINAELLGISVDGVWCHLAFSEHCCLHVPLLADFEPKGLAARSYGVYRAEDGTSERALFVIDAAGVVRWSYVSPVGVNPGADDTLRALESLHQEDRHV